MPQKNKIHPSAGYPVACIEACTRPVFSGQSRHSQRLLLRGCAQRVPVATRGPQRRVPHIEQPVTLRDAELCCTAASDRQQRSMHACMCVAGVGGLTDAQTLLLSVESISRTTNGVLSTVGEIVIWVPGKAESLSHTSSSLRLPLLLLSSSSFTSLISTLIQQWHPPPRRHTLSAAAVCSLTW